MDNFINKQDKNIPAEGLEEGVKIKSICTYHWTSLGLLKKS